MNRTSLFCTMAFALCTLSCWERQDHNILLPETPHYTLSGYTVDIDDTTLVLPHTPVHLSAKAMLYDVTFESVSMESDSLGYYQIDSVFPGIYVLSAERGGYTIFSKQFDMGHEELSLNLELPKPLNFDRSYSLGAKNPRFAWGQNYLWRFGTYRLGDMPPRPVIYRCKTEGSALKCDRWYDNPFPYATCFTYADGRFYLHFRDSLAVLSAVDPTFISFITIQDPFHGLTWDGTGFWSTYENSLQYRGPSPVTKEYFREVVSGYLGPLAWNDVHLWAYDMDRDLLLNLTIEGRILASYRPSFGEIHDLDFGWDGKLWVSSKQGVLYVFKTPMVEGSY